MWKKLKFIWSKKEVIKLCNEAYQIGIQTGLGNCPDFEKWIKTKI